MVWVSLQIALNDTEVSIENIQKLTKELQVSQATSRASPTIVSLLIHS